MAFPLQRNRGEKDVFTLANTQEVWVRQAPPMPSPKPIMSFLKHGLKMPRLFLFSF